MSSAIITTQSKKYAVLIGINYTGTNSQLNGCINDVYNLRTFLIDKCGFLNENIMIICDDGLSTMPTKQNIINGFNVLVNKALTEQYTELWLSYSGHGSYLYDTNGDENDGCDEVLCPLDYETNGMISDDFIYINLVSKLPETATLFALSDSCHSGSVFDLPYVFNTSLVNNNNNTNHKANVISISGCKDSQTSDDAYIGGKFQGAMTWSFLNALYNSNYNIKLCDLIERMRILLSSNNHSQVPQLSLSYTSDMDKYLLQSVNSNPNTDPKMITFNVKTDYWFTESSWNVWSVTEDKYIFDYNNTFTARYQNNTINKLLPVGDYKLCLRDAYGDGGITATVTNGLVTLVSVKMTTGRFAEYLFTV